MAAVGQDLSGLSAVLKEFYLGPLVSQLNDNVMITQLLRVDSENLEGLKAVLPLHYGRSGGIGSRAELATIPSAGRQKYARAEYDLRYHYARVQVSGPAISKTRDDAGAFLQAMKSELDFIKNDVQLDQARQFYGAGNGVIATVSSSTGAVTTLTSAEAISKGYIYPGAVLDGGSTTTPTTQTGMSVIDVSIANSTVTFDADYSATLSVGTVLVRSGNVTDTTNPDAVDEINAGMNAIVDTSVLGGIDPTATGRSFWQAIKTDQTASPDVAVDDLMYLQNQLINNGAMASDLITITTPGLTRRLFQSADFKDAVRFCDTTTLTGGFEQLSFAAGNGAMKINADRLHPWGQVTMLDKQHVRVFSPADWDFLARDGLTVRWVTDVDAFQSILFRYANMGTDRRNTSGRLINYTDTGF